MMHLLPSTIRKEKLEDEDAEESSSYKKQKEAKNKANSARYRGVLSWARQHSLPDSQVAGMHLGLCRSYVDYPSQ